VNTNGGAFMGEFAESLASVAYPNCHLVVVDNASTDDSLQVLRRLHPQAAVLRNDTNLGFTGACNRGLEYCLSRSFDYVLFLNGDVLMEPDFLDHLVAAADERTMTAPKSYLYHHPGRLDDSVGEFDWTRGVWRRPILGKEPTPDFDRPRLVGSANLSCLLVPSGLLRDVGLLDDSFFIYYDDTDFVRRARDKGYRLWFVPSAVIHHRKGATIGGPETAFGLYYLTRNRPYLIRKHVRSPVRLALFWCYFAAGRLVRVAIKLGRGRSDLAGAILRGIVDYWRGHMGKTVERDAWSGELQRNEPGLNLPEGPVAGT
jgi:GT2 family glycosyltransferase